MGKTATMVIQAIRQDLNLSTPQLSELLDYKSKAHVWMIEKGYARPSLKFCKKLIELAKKKGIKGITLDILMRDD